MKNKSCLLVDDEEALVLFIAIYLERMGAKVQRANCVTHAMSFINKTPYDIVISDMFMPDGTGLDILAELQKKTDHTKFILMSGNFQLNLEAEVVSSPQSLDGLPFIEKPFKLQELNSLMETVLAG